jgi:hypothetical protein
MSRHRSHSVEFERQATQEFLGGETLHGLAKLHDLSRNPIRASGSESTRSASPQRRGRAVRTASFQPCSNLSFFVTFWGK